MTRLWPNGDPVQVVVADTGILNQFLWHGRGRVRSSCWLPAADAYREYFKLTTTGGLLCTLYRDLRDNS